MTAKLAAVNLTACYAVMSGYFLAFIAVNPFGPMFILKEFKASIVSRKLLVKIFYSIRFHFFSPILFYTYTIAQNIPVVKGQLRYFKSIYDDLVWLQAKWDFYLELYNKKENAQLIYGLAQTSFKIIEDSLRSDMVMTICRLGDPSKTRTSDNLSFETLISKCDICDLTDLNMLLNEFRDVSKSIRENRNKTIGHTDLDVVINPLGNQIPPIYKKDISRTLELAQQIISYIYTHYNSQGYSIDTKVYTSSGADVLIYWLQLADKHKDDLPYP